MTDLTIPKFSKDLQQRLARRAARHGRSAQAEAREILREAVQNEPKREPPNNPYAAFRAVVDRYGGFELEPPVRDRSSLIVKPSSAGK